MTEVGPTEVGESRFSLEFQKKVKAAVSSNYRQPFHGDKLNTPKTAVYNIPGSLSRPSRPCVRVNFNQVAAQPRITSRTCVQEMQN